MRWDGEEGEEENRIGGEGRRKRDEDNFVGVVLVLAGWGVMLLRVRLPLDVAIVMLLFEERLFELF